MKTLPSLLALSLLIPTLAGCPPIRNGSGGDDDDSVGDDDDATEELSLEEGSWWSESLSVVSDECEVGQSAEELSFQLAMVDAWGAFETDWGVDEPAPCSIAGDDFTCDETRFFLEELESTALEGSIDFDGEVLAMDRLSGTVVWEVTCTGTDCDSYELPTNTTCTIMFDAVFGHIGEDEPDPLPGDGGGEDDGDGSEGP
ncbi:MAG: hypothetical protein KDA24_12135 [Deltaproteobacteria bacterium]|nr:hypothetical protein [Deltaproteobacteria bacterium]